MFCLGVFCPGGFGKGGFCPGVFCPGVYVRGGFVRGVFVLEPFEDLNINTKLKACSNDFLWRVQCYTPFRNRDV